MQSAEKLYSTCAQYVLNDNLRSLGIPLACYFKKFYAGLVQGMQYGASYPAEWRIPTDIVSPHVSSADDCRLNGRTLGVDLIALNPKTHFAIIRPSPALRMTRSPMPALQMLVYLVTMLITCLI